MPTQHLLPERDAPPLIETPLRHDNPLPSAEGIEDVLELTDSQLVDHDQECLDAGSRALAALVGAADDAEQALQRLRVAAARLDATASGLSTVGMREQAILAVKQLRDVVRSIRAVR